MQNIPHSVTDGLLGFSIHAHSGLCRKVGALAAERNGKLLVSSLAVRKFSELDGNSKNIAVVCFIIEEMVSRGGLGAVSG